MYLHFLDTVMAKVVETFLRERQGRNTMATCDLTTQWGRTSTATVLTSSDGFRITQVNGRWSLIAQNIPKQLNKRGAVETSTHMEPFLQVTNLTRQRVDI